MRLVVLSLLLASGCAHVAARPPSALESLLLEWVARDGVNHRHMLRLAHLAPRFVEAEGASLRIVEAAVLLHDATKERGTGTPHERFCSHGEQAAALVRERLPALGYSPDETSRVAQAIEEHMGPLGETGAFETPRFMTGFCRRAFATPSSPEARVVFDLDMLDLMTVDGVVKVVTLRQRNPEFAKEPLRDSALTGASSAWKSVVDAGQVLSTKAGQRCGASVEQHTRAFLDQVDFASVQTVEAFEAAAKTFLSRRPLPECVRP